MRRPDGRRGWCGGGRGGGPRLLLGRRGDRPAERLLRLPAKRVGGLPGVGQNVTLLLDELLIDRGGGRHNEGLSAISGAVHRPATGCDGLTP
ncbi:predicted protein [Streptomyces sp. SPB78]|nr:predicted protein [Streptomyces sp. SPB78]